MTLQSERDHVTGAQLLLGVVLLGALFALVGLQLMRITTQPTSRGVVGGTPTAHMESPVVQPPPPDPTALPSPSDLSARDPVATSDCGPECYGEPLGRSTR